MKNNVSERRRRRIDVVCLDSGVTYSFVAETPYKAMECMKYMLDLRSKDKNAIINTTKSGLHLWMEHSGNTYSVHL